MAQHLRFQLSRLVRVTSPKALADPTTDHKAVVILKGLSPLVWYKSCPSPPFPSNSGCCAQRPLLDCRYTGYDGARRSSYCHPGCDRPFVNPRGCGAILTHSWVLGGWPIITVFLSEALDRPGCQSPHIFLSTHYHGIIQQSLIPRVPNVKYLTLETLHNGEELVFLYQLVEGHTSSSYACHVATQAGLPSTIVKRETEVSQLIRQCKPVQRRDTVATETQFKRCQTIVNRFMDLDLETADLKSFLTGFVLPTIDGKM
ncbi:mutS protein homolog 5-like [Ruditapes philippinarum]|uniref:mutS protein homolog 5-like n=1 Tax=Ruditapes philippinarum TaxID=129788 RepID=UPI00295B024E|nr:mutS protein homolog 5-like [Ruditapes philippinarum]